MIGFNLLSALGALGSTGQDFFKVHMLEISQEDYESEKKSKWDLLYQMLKLTVKLTINKSMGNSLAVQWSGLCTFTAESLHWIPGRVIKIPQAAQHGQKKPKNKTSGFGSL